MPETKPGEAIIKVRRTALCGSDNRLWRDGAVQVPGHEIFGVVSQPGHALDEQRVCIYIPVFCGHCRACKQGYTQSCETHSVLVGWNRDGGFGEFVRVPDQCLLPVPDCIEDRLAPLLLDTVGTSAHAVRTVHSLCGDLLHKRILISGAGPIGIGVLVALLDAGCTDISVFDPKVTRCAFAQSMGKVAERVDDSNRYDIIFECSGAHESRDTAIQRVTPGGVIVLIGENNSAWTIHEGPVFRRKDFALLRSFYFPVGEHQDNIELLLRQKNRYRKIVDTDLSLDELSKGYKEFAAGVTLKPLLTFPAT